MKALRELQSKQTNGLDVQPTVNAAISTACHLGLATFQRACFVVSVSTPASDNVSVGMWDARMLFTATDCGVDTC